MKKVTGEAVTCRQIFVQKGGPFFRELEKKVIARIGQNPPKLGIISLGGGAVETAENIEIFKSIGLLIYLKTDLKELFKRINRKGLPAYLDPKDPFSSFEKLATKRNPFYEKAADIEINGALLSPDEIASEIIDKVTKFK